MILMKKDISMHSDSYFLSVVPVGTAALLFWLWPLGFQNWNLPSHCLWH